MTAVLIPSKPLLLLGKRVVLTLVVNFYEIAFSTFHNTFVSTLRAVDT